MSCRDLIISVVKGLEESLKLAALLLAVLVVGVWSGSVQEKKLREEAVSRGYAYWEVHDDGATEFKWKDLEE